MKFYVIYDFDLPRDVSVKKYQPPNVSSWHLTEDDGLYEFDYLANETRDERYRNGKHRKYTKELRKEEFERFIRECGLTYEDVQTGGSLTSEYGWLPAFAFRGDSWDHNCIDQRAYVTPFPNPVRDYHRRIDWDHLTEEQEEEFGKIEDRNWGRLAQVFKARFR